MLQAFQVEHSLTQPLADGAARFLKVSAMRSPIVPVRATDRPRARHTLLPSPLRPHDGQAGARERGGVLVATHIRAPLWSPQLARRACLAVTSYAPCRIPRWLRPRASTDERRVEQTATHGQHPLWRGAGTPASRVGNATPLVSGHRAFRIAHPDDRQVSGYVFVPRRASAVDLGGNLRGSPR